MIPYTTQELAERLDLAEARLANLEKRFVNYEHRTLPHLRIDPVTENITVSKKCPNVNCNAPIMMKRNEREWCLKCGYKNWTEESEGPIGL